jgi:trans-2,3-dihydro-3-hydroxyanthranilate isomerase
MAPRGRPYRYQRVDVFTDIPFCGKPLTVFTDASGLDTNSMQGIARELASCETTFLLPAANPGNDYSVRVFSPDAELRTSGRPTIGTAFALAAESQQVNPQKRMVFEAAEGPVSTSLITPMMSVRQPLPEAGAVYREPGAVPAMLSLLSGDILATSPLQAFSAGTPYLIVPIRSLEALKAIKFRAEIWNRTVRRFEAPTVLAYYLHGPQREADATVRVFDPSASAVEDAATEFAAGPLVAYLRQHGLRQRASGDQWTLEQGAELGRPSQIFVFPEWDGERMTSLRVGGRCVSVGEGVIYV